jgi:hypothetical protein
MHVNIPETALEDIFLAALVFGCLMNKLPDLSRHPAEAADDTPHFRCINDSTE